MEALKFDTACPKCKSTDTQSFQMAYDSGTSSGVVRIASYSDPVGLTSTAGRVTSQTALAKKIAPPTKPSADAVMVVSMLIGAFLSCGVGFVIGAFYSVLV